MKRIPARIFGNGVRFRVKLSIVVFRASDQCTATLMNRVALSAEEEHYEELLFIQDRLIDSLRAPHRRPVEAAPTLETDEIRLRATLVPHPGDDDTRVQWMLGLHLCCESMIADDEDHDEFDGQNNPLPLSGGQLLEHVASLAWA